MKQYVITTKGDKVLITAEDRDHAFAKYFKDIIERKIPLDKVGSILMLMDGNVEIPIRTVPLLWRMGIVCTDCAITNIVDCTGVLRSEAKEILKEASDKDARLIPLINQLRLEEQK